MPGRIKDRRPSTPASHGKHAETLRAGRYPGDDRTSLAEWQPGAEVGCLSECPLRSLDFEVDLLECSARGRK